ncbi:MAG: type II toxin-antitoxin system HicB family antitoxin [Shinella sp.]|nr:type II toxin-antitoxin system HicB family antitoxin [Shinella sp.]
MNNVIEISGHKAIIAYDPTIRMFRGEFLGLNGGADFYADSVEGLYKEGETSLAVFLEMCAEKNLAPFRNFSGRFNIRLNPRTHEAAVIAAASEGKSLNEWVAAAVENAIGESS